MNQRAEWIKSPSIKHENLFTLLWLTGNLLIVLAIPDLFTESFFQSGFLMLQILMVTSTIAVGKLYLNFVRKKD